MTAFKAVFISPVNLVNVESGVSQCIRVMSSKCLDRRLQSQRLAKGEKMQSTLLVLLSASNLLFLNSLIRFLY